LPPTHRPLRLEAAILSRIRSEVPSRSNWAKDSSTLRVSRPMEVVVLNCWVTETNDTPWASNSSTSLAKSANDLRLIPGPPQSNHRLEVSETGGHIDGDAIGQPDHG